MSIPLEPVSQIVLDHLLPTLDAGGFVQVAGPSAMTIFERVFANGRHRLWWRIDSEPADPTLALFLDTRQDEVLDALERCQPGLAASFDRSLIVWPIPGLVLEGGLDFARVVYGDIDFTAIAPSNVPVTPGITLSNASATRARTLEGLSLALKELVFPRLISAETVPALWELILTETERRFGVHPDVRVSILVGMWMRDDRADVVAKWWRKDLVQQVEEARALQHSRASGSGNLAFMERNLEKFDSFVVAARALKSGS